MRWRGRHLSDGVFEEVLEELELRDVAGREAAQHVEQQLDLARVVSAPQQNGRQHRHAKWKQNSREKEIKIFTKKIFKKKKNMNKKKWPPA